MRCFDPAERDPQPELDPKGLPDGAISTEAENFLNTTLPPLLSPYTEEFKVQGSPCVSPSLFRIFPTAQNISIMNSPRFPLERSRDGASPVPPFHCGMTLAELLTVLAVIGILAAILIPVTSRARDSAKVAACQSNLRELGTAVYLFAADHDDHTPPNINPELDPPELDDMAGTFVGGPGGDVRTLGWLIPEEYGGPPGSPNRYIDNPSVLFCPSLSDNVYAASDEYKRPEEISRQNPIRRTGYAWIYRIPRKEDHHNYGDGFFARNPNHKVTVENKNVPYAFDFGWTKGYGHQGPIISIPSHRNAINVLHLGGHITTISHAEADKHDGYDALYRFLAGDPKP